MDDETQAKAIFVALLCVGCFCLGGCAGQMYGTNVERANAVKAGVAAYHVVDDKGRVEFRYERQKVVVPDR